MSAYETWFDKSRLMHLNDHPHPLDSENGPLFTAYFQCLFAYKMRSKYHNLSQSIVTINPTPGVYNPSAEGGSHFSHDNMTGLYCLYKMYVGRCPKHLHVLTKYVKHPRDICFLTYAKIAHKRGAFWNVLKHALLTIPSITMMVTCYQKYKVRGGLKIIKTDGKLLAFLRCHTFGLKKTLRICEFIMDKRAVFKTWGHVFSTYFTKPDHPCNRLSAGLTFTTWRGM